MSPFSISLSFSISLCLSVPVPSPLIISQFPSASLSLFLSLGLLLPPVTPSVSLRTDFMLDAHMNPPSCRIPTPSPHTLTARHRTRNRRSCHDRDVPGEGCNHAGLPVSFW